MSFIWTVEMKLNVLLLQNEGPYHQYFTDPKVTIRLAAHLEIRDFRKTISIKKKSREKSGKFMKKFC